MATLNPLLFDTYKRYKAGTAKVVTWLAQTAEKIGFVDELVLPKKSKKEKKRSKDTSTQQVPLKCLIPLARFIVDAKHSIPLSVLRTLREVIKARKDCTQWFLHNQDADDQEAAGSNRTHQHFIFTLEVTLRTLEVGVGEGTKPNPRDEESRDHTSSENMFSHLVLEEPEESDDPEPGSPSKATARSSPHKTSTYKLEESDHELAFALYCLFKDLNEVRAFANETWIQYRDRLITLGTAAVTVNASITILRQINEAFIEKYPKFKEYSSIVEYLSGMFQVKTRDVLRPVFSAPLTINNTKLPLHITSCIYTYKILCAHLGRCDSTGNIPLYNQEERKHLDADEETLRCFFSLYGLGFYDNDDGQFSGDQIRGAFAEIRRTRGKIMAWQVFAFQLLLDTRTALGEELGRGHDDLVRNAAWICKSMKQADAFNNTNIDAKEHSAKQDPFKELINLSNWLGTKDWGHELLKYWLDHNSEKLKAYALPSHFYFRTNPMLCGLFLQKLIARFHTAGIYLAARQGKIILTMHLYNAIQCTPKFAKPRWQDLEVLLKMQGISLLFAGDRPKNLNDCCMRYHLALGTSLTSFSKETRARFRTRGELPARLKQSKRGVRQLEPTTYVSAAPEFASTASQLEMIVRKHVEKQRPKSAKHNRDLKLGPLEKLRIFRDALYEDELPLYFDLFSLHERCVRTLRCIQTAAVKESPMVYLAKKFSSDDSLAALVSWMLVFTIPVQERGPRAIQGSSHSIVGDVSMKQGNAELLKASSHRALISGPRPKVSVSGEQRPFALAFHQPKIPTLVWC